MIDCIDTALMVDWVWIIECAILHVLCAHLASRLLYISRKAICTLRLM